MLEKLTRFVGNQSGKIAATRIIFEAKNASGKNHAMFRQQLKTSINSYPSISSNIIDASRKSHKVSNTIKPILDGLSFAPPLGDSGFFMPDVLTNIFPVIKATIAHHHKKRDTMLRAASISTDLRKSFETIV